MTQIVESGRDPKKSAIMARIYIKEARATRWPKWRKTLLGYAAKRRAEYFDLVRKKKPEPGQLAFEF
jgi:hypothetical protein